MANGVLGILGAGELGQQIAEIARVSHGVDRMVFFDDTCEPGSRIGEHTVLGGMDAIPAALDAGDIHEVILGIGFKHFGFRASLAETGADWPWATLIGQGCILSPSATVGPGCVLYPGTILDRQVQLGPHNVLNLRTTVSHDCRLGPNNFLAPSTTLSGFVEMGHSNFLGTGTVVSSRITLGSGNVFGAGSIIVRDFGDGVKAYGNPAKEA